MKTQIKRDKLADALELLNGAAEDKKDEVFELIGDKYENLKELFGNILSGGEAVVGQTKKQIGRGFHEGEMRLKDSAAQLSKKVHKAPWAFLGGVALGALVLGLTLGKSK